MHDSEAVRLGELCGDERPVARLRVALDAQQCGRPVLRQPRDEGIEVKLVEDLAPIARGVLRRELAPRTLADATTVVFCVLHVAQLGRRRELLSVLVLDARVGERRLQSLGVRPHVLPPTYPAALADVEQQRDVRCLQRRDKAVDVGLVDADRREARRQRACESRWAATSASVRSLRSPTRARSPSISE
jgi:hypothetical protein